MLTGDIGRTATLAHDDALSTAELTLFRPLKFMLASPAEDAAEIIRRLGPEVWVEDKYDGIRAQLHKQGGDVRLYSRDLHDVSGQFPEIVEAARVLDWDGVVDGEILGFKDGVVLPFISLQARLGRKAPSATLQEEIPVVYVAFDLLAAGAGPAPSSAVDPAPARTPGDPPRPPRHARPAGGHGGRSIPALAPDRRRRHRRPRARVRRRSRPAQRGSHGQGPREHLLAGSARPWLAEDEEGPRDDRLRRRRRRGRPRQASRRAQRLHVRRPRRGRPARSSTSARRTAD